MPSGLFSKVEYEYLRAGDINIPMMGLVYMLGKANRHMVSNHL